MRGFKDYDVKERLARAAEARQKALEKFKARPGPDDPEVVKRREADTDGSSSRSSNR